ncbi:MAG: CDP-diacylglycerol--serine O-phosphatidyltransferase [Arenicellales bacterium]|nr:CDP-diacylglycerol--serine O-phosphatidyltransferase [Arenicellales bacterium]
MQVKRNKKGQDTGPKRPGRRGIYILPNLFTTAGLFFGFFAIIQATKGRFELAAMAIFIAMLMDGLDGRIARMTNTTSDFGAEYDSLVDVIAFGLTPALVIYEWVLGGMGKLGWLAAFIYVAATALRLARFNTQKVADKRYFQGLPSPAAAALLAAWVWMMHEYGFQGSAVNTVSWLVTVAAAAAMVSNVRYHSFKDLDLKGKIPFVKLLVMVLAFVLIALDPPRMLFLIFFGYFVSGFLQGFLLKRRKDRHRPELQEEIREESIDEKVTPMTSSKAGEKWGQQVKEPKAQS